MNENGNPAVSKKSGTGVAQLPQKLPKTHQGYWRSRVQHRTYLTGTGEEAQAESLSVRIKHQNRRAWFKLHTTSKAAASIKARDIYLSLVSHGWEQTLAIYKQKDAKPAKVATIGEFLTDVEKRSHLKQATVRRYATKLRRMVADIAELEKGLKGKALKSKFNWAGGGRDKWLAKIHAQSLSILTTDSLIGWRNEYVNRAGSDPLKRKSAERTAASCLRCTKALFSEDIRKVLKVSMPPNPFEGLKIPQPPPARYRSDINPEWLLSTAERELSKADTQAYLGFTLCLWAGLRRKEADLLSWAQVDLEGGQIQIRRTAHFEPKTEESVRDIDIPQAAVDILRRAKKGNRSEFVLDGSKPRPSATYDFYRCDHTWRRLLTWLKAKGITDTKAIHSLRKESGSLIASSFGIEAARQHLGHRDISTTSAHYVTKKKRVEVSIGSGELRPLEDAS